MRLLRTLPIPSRPLLSRPRQALAANAVPLPSPAHPLGPDTEVVFEKVRDLSVLGKKGMEDEEQAAAMRQLA